MENIFHHKPQFGTSMSRRIGTGLSGLNNSSAGRSVQIYPGIRSDVHLVENFGYQLPILVNEAMTFTEKNQIVSIKYDTSWAWVVHGRRLLVWQYKELAGAGKNSPLRRNQEYTRTSLRRGAYTVPQCRELTLPHCDIGHKASLINIFLHERQQMASCIAVSPTGDVRFWPSIAHDSTSTDLNGILDGQEFDQLVEIPQQGYLLITTTCNLVLLSMRVVNGRHTLHHQSVKQPCSFLGGFGKKFASIIIGMNSSNEKEHKFVSINCDQPMEGEGAVDVTVLAERMVQRWRVAVDQQQFIYEDTEIIRRMRDEFQQKYWNIRDPVDVELHLLEMHLYGGKHYVLAGAVNLAHTPQMFYGLVVLSSEAAAMQMLDFIPLKLTHFYDNNTKKACLSLRFIICGSYLYLYNEKAVYPLHMLQLPHTIDIEGDKIEFHLLEDAIMHAAVCDQIPVFFSRTHGLLSVTPGDFDGSENLLNSLSASVFDDKTIYDSNQSIAGIGATKNLYMLGLDPENMCDDDDTKNDDVSQMKAAFLYRIKGNNNMCNQIVNKLIRNTMQEYERTNNVTGINPLEQVVLKIAQDLANDLPASDPRWEEMRSEGIGNKHNLGSSASLQILTQLKEKCAALRHFVDFLRGTGIWEKLNLVAGESRRPVSLQISDINEKIVAAIALKKVQNKYSKIMEEAIDKTIEVWKEIPRGHLTAQDIFFVRLTKFQDLFSSLSHMAQKRVKAQLPTPTVITFLTSVNGLVLNMIGRVMSYRDQNSALFAMSVEHLENYEYLPWTALNGDSGIRDALMRLIDLSARFVAQSAAELELKQRLHQQIAELMDIILGGMKQYVESVRDIPKRGVLQQQFEIQRRDLISTLIENNQYDNAIKLAEKYLDFHNLIIICDLTKNQERLDSYITKYERYNFSQYAINWHLRQNRQGEVFERFKGNETALSQFMHDHPSLGWVQLMFNGNFERAANVLFQLAQNETELVQRKKTMLSLAKLATFAAADSDLTTQVAHINAELNLIDYQEQLDPQVLESLGYEVSNQRVLKAEEIIKLLIAEENANVNEYDFRKSLELLRTSANDIPSEDFQELRMRIWNTAILRDNWIDYDTNNAIDHVHNLLFFKLIELCHLVDGEVETFLPPVEEFLNSSDLEDLPQKSSFQYLIKLTYEHIVDLFGNSNESKE